MASSDDKIVIVDMENALGPADMADSPHPNAIGYNKMAKAWLLALTEDINGPLLQRCP